MSAATKSKRSRTPARELREWSASTSAGSPLKVDRGRGVIENVKVLGFKSRNNHGLSRATEGTEYTRTCMEGALPLYEGVDVLTDHDPTSKARGTADVFGQLRNVRLCEDGLRADLHYLKSHPLAERVCEDVERGLGVYGLSHDARAGKERFDPASKRLVIESLSAVKSVDLVRKPASNRNLWESHAEPPMTTTLRKLLEDREPKLSLRRQKWSRWLREDDMMAPSMDAPMDAPADDSADPDEALWSGFKAAIMAILDSDDDADAKAKKIAKYIKGHAKLTASSEPADEPAKDDAPAKSDDDKTEAVKERDLLKHKLRVRELVEEAGVKPDKVLLESLEAVPEATARKLLEREKARGGSPRSGSGHAVGGSTGGATGKAPADAKEFAASIRD